MPRSFVPDFGDPEICVHCEELCRDTALIMFDNRWSVKMTSLLQAVWPFDNLQTMACVLALLHSSKTIGHAPSPTSNLVVWSAWTAVDHPPVEELNVQTMFNSLLVEECGATTVQTCFGILCLKFIRRLKAQRVHTNHRLGIWIQRMVISMVPIQMDFLCLSLNQYMPQPPSLVHMSEHNY